MDDGRTLDQAAQDKILDKALNHSMDASDPVATVQPGDDGEPRASSGYDAELEASLTEKSEGNDN